MSIRFTKAICPGCGKWRVIEYVAGEPRFVLHDKARKKPCQSSGQPMPPIPTPKGTPPWLR